MRVAVNMPNVSLPGLVPTDPRAAFTMGWTTAHEIMESVLNRAIVSMDERAKAKLIDDYKGQLEVVGSGAISIRRAGRLYCRHPAEYVEWLPKGRTHYCTLCGVRGRLKH